MRHSCTFSLFSFIIIFVSPMFCFFFFFFNDPPPTEIYPLSLHDALPICARPARRAASHYRRRRGDGRAALGGARSARPRAVGREPAGPQCLRNRPGHLPGRGATARRRRSEEHTSELQSQSNLVCRLLLEK